MMYSGEHLISLHDACLAHAFLTFVIGTSGSSVQALADHKKRLQANVDAGQTMVRQIEERRGQLGRFAGDWAAACKARGAAAQQLQQAKDEQQDR